MSTLRFMSNNVWWCETNQQAWIQKGMDCSAVARAPYLARVYRELHPDMIGLQEMSSLMTKEILLNLRKDGIRYSVLWGNDTPIYYKSEVFDVVDTDFLSFAEHHEGYEGCFNNGGSKTCLIGVFRVKESGKLILFSTAHLWWMSSDPKDKNYQYGSDEVRALQISEAADRIERMQEKYHCPVVFCGDFNTDYRSQAMQMSFRRGFAHAHNVAVEYACEENGYHWCGCDGYVPYVPKPFEDAIDHILVKNAPDGFVRRFDRITPDWYLPISDHSPVYIDTEL